MVYSSVSSTSTVTTTTTTTTIPYDPSSASSSIKDREGCSKDALCRRMGALFLRHRVEQLTDDVNKLSSRSNEYKANGGGGHCPIQRRIHQRKGAKYCRGKSYGVEESDYGTGSGEDHQGGKKLGKGSCRSPFRACSSSSSSSNKLSLTTNVFERAKRVIVADASLLIYSLRTVHDYLKAGDCRVVVPCEALSTLDVLKKGEQILNFAARRSTRFLDERFSGPEVEGATSAAAKDDEKDASGTRSIAGLFPQGCGDRVDLHSADDQARLASAGVDYAALLEAPLHVQRTLSCILHFVVTAQSRFSHAPSCSLAIALPPPHLDSDGTLSCDVNGDHVEGADVETSSSVRYAMRADGNLIMHWAKRCGLSANDRLIVAPTAASWLTATNNHVSR